MSTVDAIYYGEQAIYHEVLMVVIYSNSKVISLNPKYLGLRNLR
jgi:hypothetical protein